MNSDKLREHIQDLIEEIISDKQYAIEIDGGLGFYNHEWIKEKFDIRITPYVLTTNLLQRERNDDNSYRFRYTLIMLPFDKDRENIIEIYQALSEQLGEINLDGFNYKLSPANVAFGADFAEGSGYGTRRFEALFEIEGRATSNYSINDVVLTFGGSNIKVASFKFEHSKGSFINKEDNYENTKNRLINKNLLVIEAILSSDNTKALELIGTKQKVNVTNALIFKIGTQSIIDGTYELENYIVKYDVNLGMMVAYLYFGYETEKMTIKIDNEAIPIAIFNMSLGIEYEPHKSPLTNKIKNLYLGKANAYSFTTIEDTSFTFINNIMKDLLGEEENIPIYEVEITYGGVVYTKTLLLTEINREVEGIISLNFIEGSVL